MNFGSSDLNNIDDCHLITMLKDLEKKMEKREKRKIDQYLYDFGYCILVEIMDNLNYIIVL